MHRAHQHRLAHAAGAAISSSRFAVKISMATTLSDRPRNAAQRARSSKKIGAGARRKISRCCAWPTRSSAYQQIAAGYRRSLSLKVIAITGSNGKTSTKDFVAAALGRRFRVTKTEGNFNNHVGLPRTILESNSEHEIAVWEIGMNHPGEIASARENRRARCRHHHQHRRRAH